MQAEGCRKDATSNELLDDVNKEINDHEEFYSGFFTGDWRQELDQYRHDRAFNSNTVDLIIYALSNLTVSACELFTASSSEVKKVLTVTPGRIQVEPEHKIQLFLKDFHYEPLISIVSKQIEVSYKPTREYKLNNVQTLPLIHVLLHLHPPPDPLLPFPHPPSPVTFGRSK